MERLNSFPLILAVSSLTSLSFHLVLDPVLFSLACEAAKSIGKEREIQLGIFGTKESKWHGAHIQSHTLEEYESMDKYLTSDNLAGFTIHKGSIGSIFKHEKNPAKSILAAMIPAAIRVGGKQLVCFNGIPPRLYSKHGFFPVAKVKFNADCAPVDWNFKRDGQPDLIFMIYDKKATVEVDPILQNRSIQQIINCLSYSSWDDADLICKARI
jgi:hypothetical protein